MHAFTSKPHDPRPTPAEWRVFEVRLLQAGGLGLLGAGVIFFVAANWQAWGLAGRFGLLQAGLLICVAAALRQPPPARAGQAALLLATLFTGALLALFGQSYQTGADLYELFLAWSLLALPFAVAALSGAVWAVWWVVFNIGLGLYCGGLTHDSLFWFVPGDWGRDRAPWLLLPCLANLLGAGLFLAIRRTHFGDAAPPWLAHFLLAVGLGYGTSASLPEMTDRGPAVFALYATISIGIAAAAWTRRQDVFALTALAGSWIVISTAWLAHAMQMSDVGAVFILATWLIGSSTTAAMLLMRCLRAWRTPATEGVVQ